MKILVGKTFGIGNAVLAVPMVKALASLGQVDVLVGSGPDDLGAAAVFLGLKRMGVVGEVHVDHALPQVYDVAIMAIPFDGRWKNERDFKAITVLDGRRRPGDVDRLGFDMWEKHEIEYMMENARVLGYQGPIPSTFFTTSEDYPDGPDVFLGIGFKRDPGGFGLSKHWGTHNFIDFIDEVRSIRPGTTFASTGNVVDLVQVGGPIMRAVSGQAYVCRAASIMDSFNFIRSCKSYVGNDTGMMHVAASMGLPTFGLTPYPDLLRKNPPWGPCGRMDLFGDDPSTVARNFVDFVWG